MVTKIDSQYLRIRAGEELRLSSLARGKLHRLKVLLVQNGIGRDVWIPLVIIRGGAKGPVLGVTAAVHGNELNGIPIIHKLIGRLAPEKLSGTLVAVPVVNVPGYLENKREFRNGADINRLMPGAEGGAEAEVYAHRFVTRILNKFDYLVDLHTASFGRANSLYVRADMKDKITSKMAELIGPQIIVHNEGRDGTLRAAAADLGIHAITVEVGDPNRFQKGLIRSSRLGIEAILADLNMIPTPEDVQSEEDIISCRGSYWIYTDVGGVLEVFPGVAGFVEEGETIARIRNLFGETIKEYTAPERGVVVGKSTNPVAHTGARILHLGIPR